MIPIRINLMPRPERRETLERLRNAQVGAYKSLVYRLREENEARKKLIKTQEKLIETYRIYFDFMEQRYYAEKGLRRGRDVINGVGSSERETSQGKT